MGAGDLLNASADRIPEIVSELAKLGRWLQAIGIIIIFWLIFQIVNLTLSLKRRKVLQNIQRDIKELKNRLNKLSKKRR